MQLRLIIEALALEFTLDVSSLAFEFTLGVCLLACLPGVGGLRQKEPIYLRAYKAPYGELPVNHITYFIQIIHLTNQPITNSQSSMENNELSVK